MPSSRSPRQTYLTFSLIALMLVFATFSIVWIWWFGNPFDSMRLRLTKQVKLILPALREALRSFWQPIKYHLFPPLSLITIAAYFNEDDDIDLQDEHMEILNLNNEPDLVVIQVYLRSCTFLNKPLF